MSLAYSILAHKSPSQVERLFRAIYHPDDFFALHFDRRADASLHALGRALARQFPNVSVLRSRAIIWGGATMAEVQIAAMQVALGSSAQWQHFINLTGQDFPLKSRAEIFGELLPLKDTSFVSWFDPLKVNLWKNARSRLDRYYLDRPWLVRFLKIPGLGHRVRRLLGWNNWLPHLPLYRRKWPSFFRYYGGANHVILNRDACLYLTTNPDALRIRRWLQYASHTDEIIFQTVLLNSPLASSIVNEHRREIVFPSSDSPHPTTVTEADLPRLLGSRAFFARKFEPLESEKLMAELENKIRADNALVS